MFKIYQNSLAGVVKSSRSGRIAHTARASAMRIGKDSSVCGAPDSSGSMGDVSASPSSQEEITIVAHNPVDFHFIVCCCFCVLHKNPCSCVFEFKWHGYGKSKLEPHCPRIWLFYVRLGIYVLYPAPLERVSFRTGLSFSCLSSI